MNPSEFLTTARFLKESNREGDWRSSISRSYYSLYHEFRLIFLDGIPLQILRNADLSRKYMNHDKIIQVLRNCGNPDVAALGDSLRLLKNERRRADYELDETVTKEKSQETLDDAHDLLEDISSVTPPSIQAAVRSYLSHTQS